MSLSQFIEHLLCSTTFHTCKAIHHHPLFQDRILKHYFPLSNLFHSEAMINSSIHLINLAGYSVVLDSTKGTRQSGDMIPAGNFAINKSKLEKKSKAKLCAEFGIPGTLLRLFSLFSLVLTKIKILLFLYASFFYFFHGYSRNSLHILNLFTLSRPFGFTLTFVAGNFDFPFSIKKNFSKC